MTENKNHTDADQKTYSPASTILRKTIVSLSALAFCTLTAIAVNELRTPTYSGKVYLEGVKHTIMPPSTLPISVANAEPNAPRIPFEQSLAGKGVEYPIDAERPWFQEALRNYPDSEYWRNQVAIHLAQPRTPGWVKFESYHVSQGRNPILLPTFARMVESKHVPDVLTVRIVESAEPLTALEDIGFSHLRSVDSANPSTAVHVYEIPKELTFAQALEASNAHANVAFAEPDYLIEWALAPNESNAGISNGNAWWLNQLRAYDAWETTTDASAIGPVAVYDQGILRSHEDLRNNFWVNPDEIAGNGVDDDGNGIVDDINGRTNQVFGGHGTPVAGTICGEGNNGIGYVGSAWKCQLMDTGGPLSFSAAVSDAMASLRYATDKGSRISNHSWGISGDYSQAFKDLITEIESDDHLMVIASHNFNRNIDNSPVYPASYDNDNILSIAASNQGEGRISYSNYGAVSVDIAAPTEFTTANSSGGYSGFSGTSQATPVVTGAVALAWAMDPSMNFREIKALVMNTARPVGAWRGLTVSEGILDMKTLVESVIVDTDGDGILDDEDPDDDNDGVPDEEDAFPKDATETVDTDGDGIGNNADNDDDGDGVNDDEDWRPLDPNEQYDTDGDGIGNSQDDDDDNDGVLDVNDAFPLDANETTDTDGDGVGDNSDVFPNDQNEWSDSDGDGVGDNGDIDRDNDGLSDDLESRTSADINNWPVLTGNARFNDGVLSGNGGYWNSQANSNRFSSYGFNDRYALNFTVDSLGTYNMFGLGNVESSASYTDIDYAFYVVGSTLYIYESGSSRGTFGSVAVGDTLSIQVSEGAIAYYRNDTLVRSTSYNGDTPDFYVDSSFYSGAIQLSNISLSPLSGSGFSVDADNDGINNDVDLDSDNDTIPDVIEAGLADADGNLTVDAINLQGSVDPAPDTDNDGIPDFLDLESQNPENDGTAFDMHGYDFAAFDSNGDGKLDGNDELGGNDVNGNGVDDRAEDADGDGISNPNDDDDDNDGTLDVNDAFPFDPNEDTDSDGDGVGDNGDAFPTDATETKDTDGDGVGDNTDAFPDDASETTDTDGDGVGDNTDAFPNDASETTDSDGDGVGDNSDIDRDNDGLSDELELRTKADIVDWPVLYGASFSNGELSANGGTWRYQANSVRFSEYGYRDNYRLNFTVESLGSNNMFGLGTAESSANYPDIDYAFYIVNTTLYIYESGSYRGNFGANSVATGDTLSLEVNKGTIRYLRNGEEIRTVSYSGETPDFYVDSSFYSGAIRLSGIELSPLSGAGFAIDKDADGINNDVDLDSDNDTIPDVIEAGLADADGDLKVDSVNLQGSIDPAPDSDGDGIPDYLDLESQNAANDGTAFDMHGYDFAAFDSNGDGKLDGNDELGGNDVNGNGVDDRAEDADGDGLSNPNDDDDDNDGTLDVNDAFPFDPNEDTDSDGDGVGDNADAFPTDATETQDTDGDGVGDNSDAFPQDASETTDTDGDGVGDNSDAFPNDASETTDSDGDGVGDNSDIDRDNDGLADELELRTKADIVDWPVLYGASFSNGELSANGGTWRYQANSVRFSEYGYRDNYRLNFTVESLGSNNMFGLGSAESSANYPDIDYAFYIVNTTLYIYESGSYRGNFGANSVATGDTLSLEVNNGTIRYLRNGEEIRAVSYSGETPDFYVDSSFYNGAIRLSDISLTPMSGSGVSADADQDGVNNDVDLDSDNDTIPDVIEAGLTDADGDLKVDSVDLQGTVDPAPDSDGDGIPDYLDLESQNAANDGTAFDMHGYDFAAFDSNGDGKLDGNDELGGNDVNGNGVDDRAEDADGDGLSNPNDDDDDNDGTLDVNDAFPFDPNEDTDSDGDGVGDNGDAFPTDATETQDTDGDGVGDNADAFPQDASETSDTDGDGVGDNTDAFPNDASETTDSDGDGVGDNSDIDRDNDGLADELELRTKADIVDWPVLYGASFSNGELSANGGTWRYQANSIRFSEYSYRDNYRLNFTVESLGSNNMFGLGNAESSANYPDIDYAFYIVNTTLYIYESGSYRGNFGANSVATGDTLSLEVNNGTIRYLRNGEEIRAVSYSGETPDFYVDSSFYNGAIRLSNISLTPMSGSGVSADADQDGVNNDIDLDSDNDTIPDVIEAGLADADGDLKVDSVNLQGTVDPAPDSDGDGIPDYLDLESQNAANDGTAFDMHSYDFAAFDSNGDGKLDGNDELGGNDVNGNGVDDRAEDADGDGLSNPNDDDDDNDGTLDINDAFPFDPNEDTDSDGDGVGDNGDAFPTDATETQDTDGDGVGDNADAFPDDVSESTDTDGDGVGDNADAFPNDASETTDSDGDGVGDNSDIDRDNDGLADELELRTKADIVDWPVLYGASFSNGELSANGGTWRYQANSIRFSEYGYRDNYRLNFTVESLGTNNMFGLGNAESSANYPDIDYAFYIVNTTLYIYESGSYRGNFGANSVATGDTLSLEVNNGTIRYLRNGEEIRAVSYSGETPDFYVDSSFYNGAIRLSNISLTPMSGSGVSADADQDGVNNDIDLDSDNDTIPDVIEAGLADADGDLKVDSVNLQGTVDPAPDSDGDGIPDYLDLESQNAANDGTAFDMHGYDFAAFDSNGDGKLDGNDDLGGNDVNGNGVDDRAEDADGDGLSNPNDDDDDNDGTLDVNDAFPFDPNEDTDSDGDGVGDNGDAFPTDATETKDTDGDGVGDNADAFPDDASETTDTDSDGVGDNADVFPNDASETTDSDGDGVGDNSDIDKDNDGLSDELEARTSAPVDDWPVLTGNAAFTDGVLTANGGSWGYQANSNRFSSYGFTDQYKLSFHVDALGTYNMFGLGNVEGSASYTDIDYAFYIAGTTLYIYESGAYRGSFGSVAVGDDLTLEVNNGTIVYYRNGTLVRSVNYSGDTPDFYLDTSFYSGAIRLSGIELSPLSGAGFAIDKDADGVKNDVDLDSDNDTIPDVVEAGLADADGNLKVDNTNLQGSVDPAPDSDGDGIPDHLDLESHNPENDGTAFDMHGYQFAAFDTNGDGMLDAQDGEGGTDQNGNGVDDRAEDSDSDGLANPNDEDDDNDGTLDIYDAFPFDPNEDTDSDGDGIGDNTDAFPTDATETQDTDGDGLGDNRDMDRDNDGIANELESNINASVSDWLVLTGNASFNNGSLTGNGGYWQSQANSERFSEYGFRSHYQLSFILDSLGTYNMIGLGKEEASASYGDIDYAFYVVGSTLYIYESGSSKGSFGSIAIGDTLSIQVADRVIAYFRNNELLRTSLYEGETPDFYIDSSFYSGAIEISRFLLSPLPGTQFVADSDGDGIPNDLDLDSDNDAKPDIIEAGFEDLDNNFMVDNDNIGASVATLPDSDNDGIPDFIDLESNNPGNNGIDYDIAETSFSNFDTNGDGKLSELDEFGGLDANGNGVDDLIEAL
ncbi:S8 family serine peptidase [Grimontia kaedaensis]|uniref:S8 family serine peptidase n=1 Tax=Grimontia kaedaensis TaxID=2872157 RepID=A0ABY4WQ57_9GAMM|nr:S8 family serine peptidase [Grimontia kaedaensis]USH01195.1 S8 family serine peptidase [Grimontia kaedaensis]